MAKRLQLCSAALLSLSVFLGGCQVDIQDPNQPGDETTQPETGEPGTVTNTPPVIELVGPETITLSLNSPFFEPGVAAIDSEDGDLTSAVFSDSMKVNTSVPGQYEITYRVTDSGNLNATPKKRIVVVSAPVVDPEPIVEPEPQPEETTPVTNLAVSEFTLVGITPERQVVELAALENGSNVDLSSVSMDLLNVVADTNFPEKTGSVHFALTGPINIDRYENNPIYTMAVEKTSLSISRNEWPTGNYTLTVTPYTLPDLTGEKGSVKSVSFKVVDNLIVTNVPKIAAIDLVAANEANGEYITLSRMTEGSQLNLADMSGMHVNVIAVSEDASKTGSVQFMLDGPMTINRTENNPAYALANEAEHLDINGGQLPAGDYTLIVTPFAAANAAGEAGIPLILNFSVTGQVTVPEVPVAEPKAVSDSYSINADSGSQPGEERAVSANDTYESGAVFKITKAPAHGTANMFDLGFFTYDPTSGFTGTDTFTYEINQSGKTSSASVSISVVGAISGTSTGFTAIKPSADSKLIYVSSSTGKDTNTCLSEAAPCKTVAAGMEKMRAGYPDHLYLKRGDVWRDELLKEFVNGRSAAEPSVLAFYGSSGARPKLESSTNLLHAYTLKNAHFIGIEFSNHSKVFGSPDFTGAGRGEIVFLGPVTNVLMEDCIFNHIELIVQKWTTGNPANLSLRRNIWTGAYFNETSYHRNKRPSNVYLEGVEGVLIEENVFDYGGWHPNVKGAGANMFNHNLYIQSGTDGNKLVLRNNIISRASSHGAQLRDGGLAEDNFFARNAIGLLMGYSKYDMPAGSIVHVHNNVISEGHTMIKGVDPCTGGGTVLWNHICTGAVFGLDINVHGDAEYISTGNIVSGRATGDDKWTKFYEKLYTPAFLIQRITDADKNRVVTESGNIAWHWQSTTEGDGNGYKNPGRTLADYNATLGGTKSYDEFMNKVKSRGLRTWDAKYTAKAINQYIREGFAK